MVQGYKVTNFLNVWLIFSRLSLKARKLGFVLVKNVLKPGTMSEGTPPLSVLEILLINILFEFLRKF